MGVAAGDGAAEQLSEWLRGAAGLGADVVLVTDALDPGANLRVRRLPRPGPLRVARVLEAEHQLRPLDALVAAGAGERRRMALVPTAVRGLGILSPATEPRAAIRRVEAELR